MRPCITEESKKYQQILRSDSNNKEVKVTMYDKGHEKRQEEIQLGVMLVKIIMENVSLYTGNASCNRMIKPSNEH